MFKASPKLLLVPALALALVLAGCTSSGTTDAAGPAAQSHLTKILKTKTVKIAKTDIEQQAPSATSLMPKDLLNSLNENEVLDLLAYLLSRGNPRDGMFRGR